MCGRGTTGGGTVLGFATNLQPIAWSMASFGPPASSATGFGGDMTGPVPVPVGFPPDTIMTRDQLAAALGVNPDTIERHGGIPVSYAIGPRSPRYVWGDVVAWIREGGKAA